MTRGPDPDHSDAEVLRVFVESPDPALFAVELADKLDMTTQGVYKRLDPLVDDGLLYTKKPGERTRVYWISRDGRIYVQESGSQ
jgi:predicted transcriptional regulator